MYPPFSRLFGILFKFCHHNLLTWCPGKKYCYGSMEGEYCHCDYCKVFLLDSPITDSYKTLWLLQGISYSISLTHQISCALRIILKVIISFLLQCKHGFGQEGYGKGCKGHWAKDTEQLSKGHWRTDLSLRLRSHHWNSLELFRYDASLEKL